MRTQRLLKKKGKSYLTLSSEIKSVLSEKLLIFSRNFLDLTIMWIKKQL